LLAHVHGGVHMKPKLTNFLFTEISGKAIAIGTGILVVGYYVAVNWPASPERSRPAPVARAANDPALSSSVGQTAPTNLIIQAPPVKDPALAVSHIKQNGSILAGYELRKSLSVTNKVPGENTVSLAVPSGCDFDSLVAVINEQGRIYEIQALSTYPSNKYVPIPEITAELEKKLSYFPTPGFKGQPSILHDGNSHFSFFGEVMWKADTNVIQVSHIIDQHALKITVFALEDLPMDHQLRQHFERPRMGTPSNLGPFTLFSRFNPLLYQCQLEDEVQYGERSYHRYKLIINGSQWPVYWIIIQPKDAAIVAIERSTIPNIEGIVFSEFTSLVEYYERGFGKANADWRGEAEWYDHYIDHVILKVPKDERWYLSEQLYHRGLYGEYMKAKYEK